MHRQTMYRPGFKKTNKQNYECHLTGESYEVQVLLRCTMVGLYPATIAFEFKLDMQSASFYIVRSIEIHCITALGRELAPVATYRPQSLPKRTPDVECSIVDGVPPEGYDFMFTVK